MITFSKLKIFHRLDSRLEAYRDASLSTQGFHIHLNFSFHEKTIKTLNQELSKFINIIF